MKRVLVILVLLLIVRVCCAKPDYYRSKGVFYFEKPAKELSNYYAFQYPPTKNLMGETAIVADSLLIMPTWNAQKDKKEEFSTIYSFRMRDHEILDSLVIPSIHVAHACYDRDIYLLGTTRNGVSDTLDVINIDNHLKIKEIHHYQIPSGLHMKDVEIANDNLHIICVSDNHEFCHLTIDLKTKKLSNIENLSDKSIIASLSDGFLFYVEQDSADIRYIKQSLADKQAKPVEQTIPYKIESEIMKDDIAFQFEVSGDYMVLSYHQKLDFDKEVGLLKIVLINMEKNTFVAKTVEGATRSFLLKDNSLYTFKSVFRPSYNKIKDYQVLTVTKQDLNLQNEKELITFFPREWNYAFDIVAEEGNNIALIGDYMYTNSKVGKSYLSVYLAQFHL
ncbi:MAG TPA: hypothetical protein PLE74_08030 [Candidatus Cloacimonadota bacterium]|nr:hypothetical protein [Candidatus Cloacimonadota bacterium]HPT72215.1 hypothetical protein [Candidatus Cloacimonadota bacterium]